MSNADKPLVACVFCKLPIEPQQRPSVTVGKNREAHLECYVKFKEKKKGNGAAH